MRTVGEEELEPVSDNEAPIVRKSKAVTALAIIHFLLAGYQLLMSGMAAVGALFFWLLELFGVPIHRQRRSRLGGGGLGRRNWAGGRLGGDRATWTGGGDPDRLIRYDLDLGRQGTGRRATGAVCVVDCNLPHAVEPGRTDYQRVSGRNNHDCSRP